MDWKILLAYITGSVDQELLLRNEYVVTENRILRQQITGRVRLSDGERKTLAEIGKRLGKKALEEVASIVKPDTILAWHRKLITTKFDGSQNASRQGDRRSTRHWRCWWCASARESLVGLRSHRGWAGDVLRLILHPSWRPESLCGGRDAASQ